MTQELNIGDNVSTPYGIGVIKALHENKIHTVEITKWNGVGYPAKHVGVFERNIKKEDKIIEFCYRWSDGRIEVRYSRVEGTKECEDLMKEYNNLKHRVGNNCPYFYR